MDHVIAALFAAVSLAASAPPPIVSPYAGEETRDIKTLSAEDVDDLLAGRGWGLAKAAELNGVPGPRHVLDARDELALTDAQAAAIQAIFDAMQVEASDLGTRYVDLERRLNVAFRSGDLDEEELQDQLDALGAVLARLRYAHLSAHLATARELTAEQISRYNAVRGYDGLSDDVCADAPAGHDAAMWRAHNGCDAE